MDSLDIVKGFIEESGIMISSEQIEKITMYHRYLIDENRVVNLVSRKSTEEDIWLKHLLDSILIIKHKKFKRETILDFGSGGGLPGIPLKILFPMTTVYLLDSRERKMNSVKKILKKLDLTQCFTITSRIEDLDRSWNRYFDIVVSRSVRQDSRYRDRMRELLKEDGKIYLYKSVKMEDIKVFDNYKEYDVSHPLVGTRKVIEIKM